MVTLLIAKLKCFYFVLDYLKNLPEDADDYKDTEGNDITFSFIDFFKSADP